MLKFFRGGFIATSLLCSLVSAQAGYVSAPPASMTNVPNFGTVLRTQGWSVIGSFSTNLSQASAQTPQNTFNGAVDGVTTEYTEYPSVSVPSIKLVYCNWLSNAVPNGELPNLNDIYIRARIYNSGKTAFRDVPFKGNLFDRIGSRGCDVSDQVGFPLTAATAYNVKTFCAVTGFNNACPKHSEPLRTSEVPSTTEGETNEDAVNLTASLASVSSFAGYGETLLLGYTGTNPAKSILCVGDSIFAGTGDAGGQRAQLAGPCLRVANNQTAINTQYAAGITPSFGVGMAAHSGDTLANFVSGNQAQGRLYLAQFFSTVMSDMGTNDLASGLSTMKANKLAEACLFAGQGNYFLTTTLLPKTNSSDNWRTSSNQTIGSPSGETTRTGFNDWLRDTSASGFVQQAAAQCSVPASFFNVWDMAAPVEVNSSNVITQDGGRWLSPNGQSALYSGSVTSGASSSAFTDSALSPTTANTYRGDVILFTSGTCSGTNATILIQVTTTLTTNGFGGCTPSNSDTYQIWAHVPSIDGTHPTSYIAGYLASQFPAGLVH